MNLLQQNVLLQTIQSAIAAQQVIQINFHNTWRTIEPYQLGRQNREGNILLLYGYCRDAVSDQLTPSRWQLFRLDEIDYIELTNYWFQAHVEYTEQVDCLQAAFYKLQPAVVRQRMRNRPKRAINIPEPHPENHP